MAQQLEHGVVEAVAEEGAADELVQAAAAGATTLYLGDAVDFAEDGGTLTIGAEVLAYSSADLDTDVLVLADPTTVDYEVGETVQVYPPAPERVAVVRLDEDGEAVDARVPHALYDRIPEGIREDDLGERVSLTLDGTAWVIADVLGKEPSIDGTFVDLTDVALPGGTDGLPPGASPTPTVLGGVGVLHVRWAGIANPDPVTYEVHLSTADGFTPDGTTLAAETASTAITLRTLPDGTSLAYDTTYYVRLVATDPDPGAAPASTQGSAQLHRVGNTEISAEYAYLGTLSADAITAGDIDAAVTVSGEVKTSASGQRVVMDAQGLHLFSSAGDPLVDLPTDPTKRADFKGNATMRELTVTDSLSIQTAGTIAAGAGLELVGGLLAPTVAPSVVLDHEVGSTPYVVGTPTNEQAYDNFQKVEAPPAYTDTHAYVLTVTGSSYYRIDKIDLATGASVASAESTAPATWVGVAVDEATGKVWVAQYDYFFDQYKLLRFTSGLVFDIISYVYTPPASIITKGLEVIGGVAYIGHVKSGTASAQKPGVVQVNLTTGVQGTTMTSTVAIGAVGFGFAAGTFDYGDALVRFVFNGSASNAAQLFTGSGSTLTHRPTESFEMGSDGGVGTTDCLAWAGYEFRQFLRYSQHVPGQTTTTVPWKRFTGIIWYSTDSPQWWASYTWRDSNAAGPAGTSETDQGKRAPFTMKQRYRVRLTSAAIPTGGTDDANAVSFYLGRSVYPATTDPTRTGMWLQGGTLTDGVTTLALDDVEFGFSSNPPASNDFPGSTPGYIKSGSKRADGQPMIKLDGLGAANVDGLLPPGSITMWAGASAPTGWALCNGQALNTATSPDLFAAIGYTFGGSGTSFNVPNLAGKFPLGAGVTQTSGTTRALGTSGGSDVLTEGQLPHHTHGAGSLVTNTGTAHDHTAGGLTVSLRGGTGSAAGAAMGNSTVVGNAQVQNSTGTSGSGHTHVISGDTGNGAGLFSNPGLPPYLSLNFIIKT